MKRVVIVSGACGVGKSATLRSMRQALVGRVEDVAVLETDHFYMMIDPDWSVPPDQAERYFAVSGWLLRETALGFLEAGFDWIAIGSNGLWDEAHVREFVRPFAAEGVNVHHVTLDPGFDVMCERMQSRESKKGREINAELRREWTGMLSRLRERYGNWTHVLDNSALTPAETAAAIFGAVEAGHGALR